MSVRNEVGFMSLPDFKTQIKNIREEALKIGFNIRTIKSYEIIWNQYIKWKDKEYFVLIEI